jgi:hypothetical protein
VSSEHRGEAEYLLDSKLLKEVFADLERQATERAITAKASDDSLRRICMAEIRAIRAVQDQLRSFLNDKTKVKRSPVV